MPENRAVLEGDQPLLRTTGLVLVMNTPKELFPQSTQGSAWGKLCRGVFATQDIPSRTVVEVSPVLIFTEDEVKRHTQHTVLQHYTYYWPTESGRTMTQALALGLGSMFNHATQDQNVGWKRNTETDVIVYTALRDIKAGEELCISYGSVRLWFEDADARNEANGQGLGDDENDTGGQTLAELDMSGLSKMDL